MNTNAFGLKLYEIKEVLQDDSVADVVNDTLASVFDYIGISQEKSQKIINICLAIAKDYDSVADYEEKVHDILNQEGIIEKIPERLTGRANLIHSQIKPYLKNGSVLDFGCGDGKVGGLLAKDGFSVVLTDVYRHPYIDNLDLEFRLFKQGSATPFGENKFDNVLVLTVFHHSSDPVNTIKESYRMVRSGGVVLVIESVYGINGDELSGAEKNKLSGYLSLSHEQQRMVNTFFDHFYNRVIHYSKDVGTKVNVPFNFNTPTGWRGLFEENGFVEEKVIHLGVDQPAVPEYHTLHVLRKK